MREGGDGRDGSGGGSGGGGGGNDNGAHTHRGYGHSHGHRGHHQHKRSGEKKNCAELLASVIAHDKHDRVRYACTIAMAMASASSALFSALGVAYIHMYTYVFNCESLCALLHAALFRYPLYSFVQS